MFYDLISISLNFAKEVMNLSDIFLYSKDLLGVQLFSELLVSETNTIVKT